MHLTDEESHNSRLVVFVHEFEAIDAQVMSDMWEVCSMHVSELPFVFVLCLSVPPPDAGVTSIAMSLQDTSILTTPWYLSRHYPRSALALLRVRTFTVPSGQPITEDIVLKTFYDPAFAPTLTPGSGVLDSILEHISRTDSGWVTASTGFQLAHMKHFEVEPLSFFALGMFEGKPLRQCIEDMLSTGVHSHTLEEMLRTLRERLSASTSREVISNSESRRRAEVVAMKGVEDLASLLDAVDEARRTFHTRARSFKMAFQLLLRVREWMLAHGYRSADPAASQAQANSDEHGAPVLKLLLRITKGEASRDIRWLGMMIKKLSAVQTHSLLSSLRELEEVVSPDSSDVGWAQTRIATYLENLSKLLATQSEGFNNGGEHNPFVGEGESSHACQTSREFGEWFVEWAQEQLTPLDKCTLWEIWYTGSAPFPVEMLNPAPRKAVVSALYHPVGYIGIAQQPDAPSDVAKHNKNVRIWELPDTSILFRGYLEAGRMINVYDWYESFAVVLEQQRDMQIRLVEVQQCTDRGAGSRRSIRKGKMSTAGRRSRDDGGQISARHKEEMEEEIWKMEIRARFMRALHELDRLGLIKHTGRKADHVIKTVYDQLE
ncbi:hypothetical protein PUNSTDRAFT_49319 [Punctularia strigosozonata HHB-11173 SS5]|uniref:uncharacterized protein n=1 Tax=Punctularia strigosozonata (strain HHB-11173) TaxID=741275 RepID=UPI00044182BC|nr:uncharacterized protein PUNSTDRAFT_49319 [Punctularia strigosozonata HHB-11173 SS5]EIN14575.1 hypothetical protein PUNSTDRAFT_49319 [Punctularia strigosozonata HHB-11173 SS5]